MRLFGTHKTKLPSSDEALPDRKTPTAVPARHAVLGTSLTEVPAGYEVAVFALGCFWGAEQEFWQLPGVYATAVGYAGGITAHPSYEEVCSGRTGHAEAVRVVYDPAKIAYGDLLKTFWENHDPTQGMRQGNDRGTQYRSAVYVTDGAQQMTAQASRDAFQASLTAAGYGEITTEIAPLADFYFAEDYHQQYLHKVPNGYCPVHATGVAASPQPGSPARPAG